MSLAEEVGRKLETLRKAAQDYSVFLNAIEGKKQMKENDLSSLESKIERLRRDYESEQARASAILQKATDESQEMTSRAKKLLMDAEADRLQASEDTKKASKMIQEAQSRLSQAEQKQKEADNMYRALEEKKNKLHEALR